KVAPGAAGLDLPIDRAGLRIGSRNIGLLQKVGIATVGDALRYYPYRHHDFTRTVPISALRFGEEQTVRGRVVSARELRMGVGGRMRSAEVVIADDSGASIQAVWFNQPYMAR